MTDLATNKKIAELKGWTNINELGGSLIGTPPAGLHESRGQRLVPDWAGYDGDAFSLLCEVVKYSPETVRMYITGEWLAAKMEG